MEISGSENGGKTDNRKVSLIKRLRLHPIKSTSAWGDVLIFALFLLAFGVARFIGILVHELGHGLSADALGGDFFALYVSPGTGFSYVYTEPLDWGGRAFVDISGVLFQMVLGMLLFILYPRFKGFFSRIITLQLFAVLLIYPLLYLGLGTIYGGDGASIVREVEVGVGVDIAIPLLMFCLLFAAFFMYFVSVRVLDFIREYFHLATERDRFKTLFLFFSLPLFIGLLGAILAISLISLASVQFLIVFLIVANLMLYVEISFLTRKAVPEEGEIKRMRSISRRESYTVFASFAIIAAVWFASFGPTPSTAHGILLKEPPIGFESHFREKIALNVDVFVKPDEFEVEVRLRGLVSQSSPLEDQIWKTYDGRAHMPFNENVSRFVVSRMFDISEWTIESTSLGPEVYGFGTTYGNSRVVRLSTNSTEQVFTNSSGSYTLNLYDPWLNEPVRPTENYLHMLNVTWSDDFNLSTYSSNPMKVPRSDLATYLEWKNIERGMAPRAYTIEF
jgi:hypothetical protein